MSEYFAVSGLLGDATGFVGDLFGFGSSMNYEIIDGVARPKDNKTKEAFKSLQRAINGVNGNSILNIDGLIGSGTVSSYQMAARKVGATIAASMASVDRLAHNADKLAGELSKHVAGTSSSKATPGSETLYRGGFENYKKFILPIAIVGGAYWYMKNKK